MGPCRLVISYIRFGGDFCFHLQCNLAIDNIDGGDNKVAKTLRCDNQSYGISSQNNVVFLKSVSIPFLKIYINIFITDDSDKCYSV
jgi:hypothetical protein